MKRFWYGPELGSSMSFRATNARGHGKYPKTDFKSKYQVTDKSFRALTEIGVIFTREWHHTGKFGRRTDFYEWARGKYTIYDNNKSKADKFSREGNIDELKNLFCLDTTK